MCVFVCVCGGGGGGGGGGAEDELVVVLERVMKTNSYSKATSRFTYIIRCLCPFKGQEFQQ